MIEPAKKLTKATTLNSRTNRDEIAVLKHTIGCNEVK